MPLGAARIALLAKTQVTAVAEVIRYKKGITAVGNAQVDTAQYKFGGASALFDGTDDRLEINPATTYDDFTVECWIRLANNSGTKNILAFGNESTGRVLFAVYNDRIYWDYYGTTARYGNTSMSANTWYHLAWSRTGSTIKLFVDGVEQTMTTSSGSGVFPSGSVGNTNGIFIGTLSDGAIDFNGHIDEIRVSNTARYTTGFTPSTAPFVNDENTTLLLHCNGTDGSTYFEDDNGAREKVGITALNQAQVDTAQSKFGGSSLLLDGTGDYLQANNDDLFNFGTDSFTIEFFMRSASFAATQVPISNRTGSTGASKWWCEITTAAKMYWAFYNSAGTVTYVNLALAGTAFSTNTWYHIALVNNAGTAKMYIDGTQVGADATLSGSYGSSTFPIYIGGLGGSFNFNGHIDEVRISPTARYTSSFTAPTTPFTNDADTLLLVHMDGTDASTVFLDDNGSRTKVGVSALGNAQVDIAQSKFGGSSALFDGTGDYIDFQPAGFTSTENFTYEFWIRFNAVPTSGAFQMIGSSSTSSNRYFAYTNNAGTLRFETGVSGSDGSFYQWWNTTLSTGVWYHIAFVKSGSSLSVYKDGTALTSSGTSGTMTINKHLFNDGVGRIGAWYNAVNSVNGWIDEIRISDTARYTTGFTAPTAPFQNDANTLLLLHMDGTDASTVFVDDNGVTPNHSY